MENPVAVSCVGVKPNFGCQELIYLLLYCKHAGVVWCAYLHARVCVCARACMYDVCIFVQFSVYIGLEGSLF